jgi:hypothetical protein
VPLLEDIKFEINVDDVLRAQGADPHIIRGRKPYLVEVTEATLKEGFPLLRPMVMYERFGAESFKHETLKLANGGSLKGRLVAQHLAPAEEVIVILSTVGFPLEKRSIELVKIDPVAGLALEGVGSAGVEALANAACNYFEKESLERGKNTTIPLSPGMAGWPVDQGQDEIFSLIDSKAIGVTLTPSYLMLPRKSLSMVIGIGEDILSEGTTCDYCTMKETCRYQDHYSSSLK